MLKYLVNSKMILDAGCGTGWFGEILSDFIPATVVGIDQKLPKTIREEFLRMAVESPGFKDSSFDCILAKDVIEHLIFPQDAMKEFHRILRSGGTIIITAPSPEAPFVWEDYTHVRPFTKKSIHQLLVDSGFNVVDIKFLARSTIGAAVLRIEGLLDFLAALGFRRGNILAIGQKSSSEQPNSPAKHSSQPTHTHTTSKQ